MAEAWLRASSLQSHCPQVLTAHKELNGQIKFPTSSSWAELKSSLTFHPATKILKISYVQQVTNWLWFPCAQDVRNIWDIYFFCFVEAFKIFIKDILLFNKCKIWIWNFEIFPLSDCKQSFCAFSGHCCFVEISSKSQESPFCAAEDCRFFAASWCRELLGLPLTCRQTGRRRSGEN